MSFAFAKTSPYFRFFQHRLLALKEEGVVDVLRQKWLSFLSEGCDEDSQFIILGREKVGASNRSLIFPK